MGLVVPMRCGWGEEFRVLNNTPHRASSRDIFPKGAHKAALCLADKSLGLYLMQHVLGLK